MLQERVLSYLEQERGEVVTGGQIARQLGVSRTAVWKAVHALQEKGHEIETMANRGYRLTDSSDGLSVQGITSYLSTQSFGRELELHETISSTNNRLKELNTASLPEGYTVAADEQTSGRGRLGRTFSSPAGQGIYFSVLLKPEIELQDITLLTICAASAVCRAVDKICGVQTDIKWVNDVFLKGRKLCGILSEAFISAELQKIEGVVVGIGINTGVVDAAVKEIAVSLLEITGQRGLRNQLLAEVLNQLEKIYYDFTLHQKREEILASYSERLLFMGKQVELAEGRKRYQASVLGVDENGALRVRTQEGNQHSVISGEIIISKNRRIS